MRGSCGTTVRGRNSRIRWKRRQGQANVALNAPSSPEKGDKESDDDEAARQPQEQRRSKELQP
jgi:hypothetical protein